MYTPIIVGVGDVINRSKKAEDAIEPLKLMSQAIETAIKDTGLSSAAAAKLKSSIDSIDAVRCWTWPYPDLPGSLCDILKINPEHRHYHPFNSGSTPGLFFDQASRRISSGETKVAVLTGGEALASIKSCLAEGRMPPPGWTNVGRSVSDPTARRLADDVAGLHGIGTPMQGYPLFENGFRAHRGQSIPQNIDESAKLYEHFAAIASKNPNAWFFGNSETANSIKTVTKQNRMICFPYPLLMNAMNLVNISGAVLLTSAEYAAELGIPRSKWIYALGGAGTRDSPNFWERPNFYSSPSISRSLDAAIEVSGLRREEIDLYDFYSCFPIVPKIAAHVLGLPITNHTQPVTLLGGLTFFGGAGNNYSMHSIIEMARALRNGRGHNGLVLANGGIMTYQHVVVMSVRPRPDGSPYPERQPLPEVITDISIPPIEKKADGEAVLELTTTGMACRSVGISLGA
ncbi:unnamed protein product [Penicillium nalgiovense]|uniref:Thiolase-like protein type 1 additional C-terminal domain-containing protein n=1 Tax=Penicillium nalgiovense TaxID=60175 RepID=A0A9W4HN84_PENNA|nr:unnamed protein product [Penicillium nalgiovense]CAG7968818.1 unnamed protein product [Penicillium nalgiovense]CAG7981521.1 unnamed protein product [Penicillium nalgiovense]CAG7997107.1 unnamed protein product [Penicillium nalgiovense]CAG8033460.1 unnamed protein product [Penicillium nalgiovense]